MFWRPNRTWMLLQWKRVDEWEIKCQQLKSHYICKSKLERKKCALWHSSFIACPHQLLSLPSLLTLPALSNPNRSAELREWGGCPWQGKPRAGRAQQAQLEEGWESSPGCLGLPPLTTYLSLRNCSLLPGLPWTTLKRATGKEDDRERLLGPNMARSSFFTIHPCLLSLCFYPLIYLHTACFWHGRQPFWSFSKRIPNSKVKAITHTSPYHIANQFNSTRLLRHQFSYKAEEKD